MKARECPQYLYELTTHYKITKQAEQLRKFHDSKKEGK